MSVYNLNDGAKVEKLFTGLDEAKLKKVKEASVGGFSLFELKSLEDEGLDISIIKNNAKLAEKSQEDVEAKITELTEKYAKDLKEFNGDCCSADNPQLKALNNAMNDGVILQLGKDGFSKMQIIQIIEKAFPTILIRKNDKEDSYDRPIGHGKEAQEIYSKFTQHLLTATTEIDDTELKKAKEELKSLNDSILSNNKKIETLQSAIKMIQTQVEQEINQAIEESEEIQEEHKQKAKEAIEKNLDKYTNSNGEMTYNQFQQNVAKDLAGIETKTNSLLSDVVLKIINANNKLNTIKSYVSNISGLSKENKTLAEKATAKKDDVEKLTKEFKEKEEEAKKAAESGSDSSASLTDPIGFTSGESRFDFFVDKDNNNDITNEQEFVGAKNGFEEMINFDTDKDGKVTASELQNANVKIVQTNSDGTQKIVNADNIFKNETDGINLNSYQTKNEDIGNGNTLLGTFDVSLNNETKFGYQTLDTNDWLDKNYEFTDEINGTGRFAQDYIGTEKAIEVDEATIKEYNDKNTELEGKIKDAFEKLGISENMIESLNEQYKNQSKEDGATIKKKFEDIARKEEEKAQYTKEKMKADLEKFNKKVEEDAAKVELDKEQNTSTQGTSTQGTSTQNTSTQGVNTGSELVEGNNSGGEGNENNNQVSKLRSRLNSLIEQRNKLENSIKTLKGYASQSGNHTAYESAIKNKEKEFANINIQITGLTNRINDLETGKIAEK